ncbi:Transcription initiation protein spt3 [Tilletia horrida]|nr:Transcription initiation protein spt3 [Tilletia horrida]
MDLIADSSALAEPAAGPSGLASDGVDASANGNAGAASSAEALLLPGEEAAEYQYSHEIAQMMFVFGDVEDPPEDVLKLVEDIVRTQVVEMIIQSRRISQRRASRSLAPEDLIFLIRYDRAKVNRLRIYLSWKEVRKKAKESDDVGAGAGGDADIDDAGAMDSALKARKMNIKLPWEIGTIFSEHLRPSAGDDADEEDEDDIEAHEDSLTRLKEADEATREMTREEYVHYSECRQASFTFRKAKKFREFINAPAYLEGGKPNDDIVDILGFLAFEVVRELCEGALKVYREHIETARLQAERRQQALEAIKQRERDQETADRDRDRHLRETSKFINAPKSETNTDPRIPSEDSRAASAAAGHQSLSAVAEIGSSASASEQAPTGHARTGILKATTRFGGAGEESAEVLTPVTGSAAVAGGEDQGERPRKRARFSEVIQESVEIPSSSSLYPRTGPFRLDQTSPSAEDQPVRTFDTKDPVSLCALFAPADDALTPISPSPTSSPSLSSDGAQFEKANGASLSSTSATDQAHRQTQTPAPLSTSTASRSGTSKTGSKRKPSELEDGDDVDEDGDDADSEGEDEDAMEADVTQDAQLGASDTTDKDPVRNNEGSDEAAPKTDAKDSGSSRRPRPEPPRLTTAHIYEAFARLQRRRTALAGAARTSGTGGLRRTRMFVI